MDAGSADDEFVVCMHLLLRSRIYVRTYFKPGEHSDSLDYSSDDSNDNLDMDFNAFIKDVSESTVPNMNADDRHVRTMWLKFYFIVLNVYLYMKVQCSSDTRLSDIHTQVDNIKVRTHTHT